MSSSLWSLLFHSIPDARKPGINSSCKRSWQFHGGNAESFRKLFLNNGNHYCTGSVLPVVVVGLPGKQILTWSFVCGLIFVQVCLWAPDIQKNEAGAGRWGRWVRVMAPWQRWPDPRDTLELARVAGPDCSLLDWDDQPFILPHWSLSVGTQRLSPEGPTPQSCPPPVTRSSQMNDLDSTAQCSPAPRLSQVVDSLHA